MKDSRDYILRLWSLAEDMVIHSGKPLHAFLLLHHVLTKPPPSLRRASGTTAGKPSINSSGVGASTVTLPTAATSEAALPLHVTAFDAEWKCEELVTRLRAAEYLLLADVPAARTAVSSASTAAPAASSPRTLSCTAGLEALELAEQVLAPVFATTSLSVSTDTVPGAAPPPPPYQQASSTASWWHRRCRASKDSAGGGDKSRGSCSASYSLDDVLREVADVSRSSASAAARSSSDSLGASIDGTGAGVQSRVASMYFLNHATVTALAWPLSSFTLAWPMREAAGDGADRSHRASGDGEQHLRFGPASETITISVSLVVRAHVLQAFICHRRAQHKRALQCLAEARQWIAQQYTDAARARTVRLLWEDLQERWAPPSPPPPQQQQQSSGTSSSSSATAISAAQLPPLPAFYRLIERLIAEEGRSCAAMVQVEECKVHYAILQACGSLPPPPPLPVRTSSIAVTTTLADASAQMQAHAADLRLHYRRYQESLQLLHVLSRAYMTVVRWIEEEAQGDVMTATAAEAPPPNGSMDVPEQGVAWREALRCVRSQLSPFCLCALQYTCNRATPVAPRGLATDTAATTTTADVSPCYALGFDVRLAAEVLGLYHCLSYVYLLYQQSAAASTLQPLSAKHHESLSVVELMARGTGGGGCSGQQSCNGSAMEERTKDRHASRGDDTFEATKEEVAFLRRYRSDPAYVALFGDHQIRPQARQTLSSLDAALDTDAADDADVLAITRDLVHSAVEHAKINAFVFGQWRLGDAAVTATLRAPSSTSANVKGEKRLKTESAHNDETGGARDQCEGVQVAPLLRWCAPKDAEASTAPATAHEAALLWCLVELGLRDNYPFVIRFLRELSGALSRVTGITYASGEGAADCVAAPPQLPEEAAEGEVGVGDALPTCPRPEGASLPGIRKHSRSPSPSPMPLMHRASHGATSRLQPPPSGNWVFPGFRRALQLYLELVTVLMRSAATMHATSSTAATGAEEPQSAAAFSSTATSSTAPSIPILRLGLHDAEQLMAQVLFTVDAEMLHLTGNTWGIASGASAREGGCTRVTGATDYRNRNGKGTSSGDISLSHLRQRFLLADQLQCSAPAQLRGLVQIKAAALVTMARHHLTQLSLVRAVHYLREGQQFARVFHRQAKLTLVPEMHVLLACLATCMSLRRLPDLPEPAVKKGRRSEGRGHSVSSGDGEAATDVALGTAHDALYASAQGWISAERATSIHAGSDDGAAPHEPHSLSGHHSSHVGNGTGAAAFAVPPREESTVAQDVGLPYLHLLAAERAACTTLHTPPSLSLLLYILKAWTVFHLVTAGEELVWSDVGCNVSSLLTTPPHAPTPLQQQQSIRQMNGSPSMSAAVPRSLALKPASPSPPFLPLPSPSHATTTLNTTVEDQQRRVARLDSLTSTPTSTPTLRSRHATVPTEMHRIQLEPAIMSAATARATVQAVKGEGNDDEGCGVGRAATGVAYVNAKGANDGSADGKVTHSLQSRGSSGVDKSSAVNSESGIGGTHVRGICTSFRGASAMAATASCPAGAHVRALPHTQRHRAGDVLQRMMAVLLDHYETHGVYAAPITAAAPSLSTEAERATLQQVPAAAWTPQNVALFRLLRGAVLLCENKDEPAAARELKEATHIAKRHLGVLHPYVADGLALLASAYASLDVDAVPSGDSHSHGEPSGSATSPSPQQVTGGAARTRKVAVQVAMRCSCMALASLYATSAANGSDSVDAAGTTTAQQQQQQTAPLSTIGARLQEWWGSQVLHGLCGSGSGGYNANAVQHLRLLFGWLPGSAEYCFS
ncbi:conserved hypothetical protein [Leishmania infantum JPCM5]|uniref:Uncharacterized protein n=2 Tax=Leishmania infantum TaxID=5671 RepID=A4HYE2_LEIIN|nr:conserved hypothetical protein [Leishmania infantum JPCM5]CAC9483336.1 hypothetical_protein_-_conserved [Leishmania infantum]CAM67326.2 conserved hypothetical protein [Leishmania infantum JPCM5]SUZ41226.1 hypothetical_protein_-_conserved [Leishmania infantum]|eukprot:XP_001465083.2 conserved hypothetical protein [Leishmania infantum JPCM5]